LNTGISEIQDDLGLFGRFTADGKLVTVFGNTEFDIMRKYGSTMSIVRDMNRGILLTLPSGNIAFVYYRRPLFLEYSPDGRLVSRRELELPWRVDLDDTPVWSDQMGIWFGRPFITNADEAGSGFLISSRDWRLRGRMTNQGYIARYDWDGTLNQYIHVPKYTEPVENEGLLMGVTELNGECWVAVYADPNIRKLVVK
jgi:hypothetical protein